MWHYYSSVSSFKLHQVSELYTHSNQHIYIFISRTYMTLNNRVTLWKKINVLNLNWTKRCIFLIFVVYSLYKFTHNFIYTIRYLLRAIYVLDTFVLTDWLILYKDNFSLVAVMTGPCKTLSTNLYPICKKVSWYLFINKKHWTCMKCFTDIHMLCLNVIINSRIKLRMIIFTMLWQFI